MSFLKSLKESKTLSDMSHILGFSPKALSFVLYKIPDEKKYSSFQIQKKNGEIREIRAPEPRLKNLQRRLANLLNSCSSELDWEKNKQPLAHGFKKNLSIYTNAKLHKNRRYVLNFDIKDFFPTINFGRVRGYFIKNRDFELNQKVATIIAQIACHENQLPQGSPCSPIISNYIAHLLDVRLVQLAKQYGCSYSRYADDITFSTNQKEFPKEIAYQDTKDSRIWHLNQIIENQVMRSGFKINPTKTNLMYRSNRQVVTGLVVNEKINVRTEYYKLARAMAHSLFQTGEYKVPACLSPIDVQDNDPKSSSETGLARLEGVLNHIHFTRNLSDQRKRREKQDNPTAIWNLYKRFLFFKHFGSSDKPVIFCEGPSDSIYIKLALKKLIDNYPSLIEKDDNKFHYKIKFLRYSRSIKDVLRLSGGTGEMAGFVWTYKKKVASYPAWSSNQPVILLTDNDNGAKKVFKAVTSSSQSKPGIEKDDNFYYINSNLYLIKTPHLGKKKETVIEDFFDSKWLKIEIDGKKFSLDNDHSPKKYYGKMDFAEKVIGKNFDDVSFDKFIPLLDRFVDLINNHKN